MANVTIRQIQLARYTTAGLTPPTSGADALAEGEEALNLADKLRFIGTGGGAFTTVPWFQVGGGADVYLDDYFIAAQVTWDAALGKAMDDLPHGGRVRLKKGVADYTFNNLTLRKSIYLYGNYDIPPFPGTNQSLDLNGLQKIRIKTGGTASIGAGAGVVGCVIAPDGMTFPRTSSTGWVGTAVTLAGDGALIENCLIVGFDKAVSSITISRTSIRNLFFDCNNGIDQQNSFDTARWSGLHGWPFATIEAYAASFNKLPDGDPNKTVDGYDARINVRSGFGIRLRNHADDTHVDDAILVGFLTGLDIASTGGAYFGRLWCECYSREGSIGIKAGSGIGNIHIADYQAWACAAPISMDCTPTEELTFGTIEVHKPMYSVAPIRGGNLHFDKMIVRDLKPGNPIFGITDTGDGRATVTRITGMLIDYTFASNDTPAVSTPPGCIWANFDGLNIQAPYRPAGWAAFGGNIIFPQYLTAAATVLLPPQGKTFRMQGGTTIGGFGGGHGGREVRILFKDPVTVNYNPGNAGGIAGSVAGVSSRAFPAGGILEMYYDAEYVSWRERSFVDFGGAGGNSAFGAWTAFNPAFSNSNGGASISSGGAYLKIGTTVFIRMSFVVNNASGGGFIQGTLPFAPAGGTKVALFGVENAVSGKSAYCRTGPNGGSQITVGYYDNTDILLSGAGAAVYISGVYDAAS